LISIQLIGSLSRASRVYKEEEIHGGEFKILKDFLCASRETTLALKQKQVLAFVKVWQNQHRVPKSK
ncbi:MAG: hypothetical protein N0E48_11870, partial [Candidatus Thiodiazotropha endolucinida]|nr:hypothetical protein [Candidatus Thiodiazotropha taylori]MCW4344038.1 hypothetical protein [Candidatus Thiodiazotropha endolucinida]